MRLSGWFVSVSFGLAAVAVAACGDPVSGDPVDITGSWVLHEMLSAADVACESTLSISFFQIERDIQGTFALEGFCILAAGDTATERGSGVLGNGAATTEGINFQAANCFYEGTLYHMPADSAAGAVSCDAQINGVATHLTGPWYASRQ